MFLSLWVHGTAGDTDTPCGEVDVFDVSGEKIDCLILEKLINYDANPERMDWFGHLPTECALLVEAKDVSGEDGVDLQVMGYFKELASNE